MKVSAASILLATALGVSAHPSGHGHRHMHRSVEARDDFFMALKPVVSSPQPTTSTTPPPPPPSTTSTTPQAAPTSTSSSPSSSASGTSSSSGSGSAGFCNGVSKRATAAEIAYQGNLGAPGNYGCNMKLVESADGYDYVSNLSNESGDEQSCACWLKIGPSGGINGFFKGNQVLSFSIPSGGSKILVVEKNTQGGCSCTPGSLEYTSWGEIAGTWYEFDMGNESNNGWSGADASSLVAAKAGMTIPGLQVCGHGTCSTINAGGSGTNAFVAGTAADDGLGLNIPAGNVQIDVKFGYSG